MSTPPAPPSRARWPIDPEGIRLSLVFLIIAIVGYVFGWWLLCVPALLLFICVAAFFRDPRRRIPRATGAIVSPADGTIDKIFVNDDAGAGPVGGTCISIFLSVLDVHINRCPYEGEVVGIQYKPGQFLDARDERCRELNEANWIFLKCGPHQMTVRQVAGLIARRIICRVRVGQKLRRGERIGLIRFGSRTELYLPPGARVEAQLGQKVKGAETILAWMPGVE